ncbi:MAG: type II secretion system protein [Armatimonadetes bacterium]|nr:type II secretion system protein [Armatimonadota bacterium]
MSANIAGLGAGLARPAGEQGNDAREAGIRGASTVHLPVAGEKIDGMEGHSMRRGFTLIELLVVIAIM